MTPEAKLRLLASTDDTLIAIFGTGPFRWNMDGFMEPGYLSKGTCARIRRVSTASAYAQEAPVALEKIRFQFDFMDVDPKKPFVAASAVATWFQTSVNLMSNASFTSPPGVLPRQRPNYSLNQRTGPLENHSNLRVFIQTVDWLVFNNPNF